MRHRRLTAAALTAALVLAACADEQTAETTSSARDVAEVAGDDGGDDVSADTTTTTEARGATTTTTEPVDLTDWESSREECRPAPDRTITHLDPVVIPALDVAEQHFEAVTLDGGVAVDGFTVEGTTVAEQVIDTGCIVEHHAPAGCLGAVEISSFEIPGAAIPGVQIPGATIPGHGNQPSVGTPAVSTPEVSTPAVSVPAVATPQVCQIEPAQGGMVAAVLRPAVLRPAVLRPAVLRPRACDGGDCVDSVRLDSVRIDSVRLDSVRVDSVRVDSERLPSYRLEGTQTDVVESEDSTAYLAPADVLFAFDESVLGPDALPTLQAIAAELADAAADAPVLVEGHTDAVGTDAYNQTLSEARAQAVADWLIAEGGIAADRITTAGYGKTAPVADNDTDEGRAQNRRVVISVAT